MNAQRAEWRRTLDAAIEAWRPLLQASSPHEEISTVQGITKSLLASRGVPDRLQDVLITGNFRVTEAIETLRSSLGRGTRIVVLEGETGTGKTFAASWLVAQTARAKLVRAAALQRIGLYDKAALDSLCEVPRLVIDDLGVEYNDERGVFRAVLEELINARYDNGSTTVITTNLSANEFTERYGERVIDRIREVGLFMAIGGKSMRRKAI